MTSGGCAEGTVAGCSSQRAQSNRSCGRAAPTVVVMLMIGAGSVATDGAGVVADLGGEGLVATEGAANGRGEKDVVIVVVLGVVSELVRRGAGDKGVSNCLISCGPNFMTEDVSPTLRQETREKLTCCRGQSGWRRRSRRRSAE
jgi:hypothetical protein